ncbi:hypothetical protein FKM82_026627, partial [Ascaphus truei]
MSSPAGEVMATARTVGIFSRDVENSKWLEQLLKSEPFHKRGIAVRPVYISNDGSQFRGEVSHCTFAILYHTKNRGRVNVTNVTDSLYDTELDHLYNVLGKPNVIVVIDDLEDSSSEKKNDILQNQSSIKEQARELFLFSTEEKDNHTITSMKEKIKTMKEILCEGNLVQTYTSSSNIHRPPAVIRKRVMYN